jgi:hypothetical protein
MIILAVLLASILMAACGLRSVNSSSETLTVYEDAPTLTHLDLGPPGNSPGDVYHFFAPLRSKPDGPVIGEVFGSKTLSKVATEANPDSEKRATLLFSLLPIVRIKLSLWVFTIIRRLRLNLMQESLSPARYWAARAGTWVRVAN